MAKNKNRQQPAKSQERSSAQDPGKSSMESTPEPSPSAPSPMHMAGKRKEKKFGHN
ncbi:MULTISPECIES: hypothetical protein [unclassified Streptomyces]|uniref:hypothetical protein n=1 Tax=unclassified Streptomyces TaxID=2593676 RepID=UPI00226E652A|nr:MULTISPECIES: hypothetical protein [unclassified Streptomyces]MCY0921190.1 hypothetical protein [Streptomyces sp. H27-G5]MCY0960323.1 hypothetical protein [Streptomyces sp. H27-H5]